MTEKTAERRARLVAEAYEKAWGDDHRALRAYLGESVYADLRMGVKKVGPILDELDALAERAA